VGQVGDSGAPRNAAAASFARRMLALVYEALLLFALFLIASLPFVMIAHQADQLVARPLFQLYLVAVAAVYFTWQWRHGGQTLPMKTWRLWLVTRDGAPLGTRHALRRFLFALPGTLLLGAGFVWALVDHEGLFLHDRLAGTKIIKEEGEGRKEEVVT
jgi:uncharacterized RDD family membrane protein YckC